MKYTLKLLLYITTKLYYKIVILYKLQHQNVEIFIYAKSKNGIYINF